MGISKQSIEDLKKRSKISDFVLSTTTGKLRGTKGMALCPFHGEKTASMSFTDVENLFHCFGCKMGGDIYKYVQEINNLEFQDAVELVAEKYGFKLTYTETSQTNDFKNFQQKINLIDEYFKEMMDSEKSKKAKDYLTSRKFNEQDLKRYDVSFIDSNVVDGIEYTLVELIPSVVILCVTRRRTGGGQDRTRLLRTPGENPSYPPAMIGHIRTQNSNVRTIYGSENVEANLKRNNV